MQAGSTNIENRTRDSRRHGCPFCPGQDRPPGSPVRAFRGGLSTDCAQCLGRNTGQPARGGLFAQKVFDLISQGKLEVIALTDRERESARGVPNHFGAGERDSVMVAQKRGAFLLSNESRVGDFCREKEIGHASLPSILCSCRLNCILDLPELRQIDADLGTKDRMKFNEGTLEAIFSD